MQQSRTFVKGLIYHICNKSIANYGIFKYSEDASRFLKTLDYYNSKYIHERFSRYLGKKNASRFNNLIHPKDDSLIKFLSYCIMPDHYHIVIKVLEDKVLSRYINNIENSYTRYFNIKYDRKGPLWQSLFRAVLVTSDEQLSHVTRYVHLNPTSSKLVENPEDWELSSYRDYITNPKVLTECIPEITINDPKKYKRFCDDQKDYQAKLRDIKKLLLE